MSGDFVSYFFPVGGFRKRGGGSKAPEYNEDEQKKLLEEFPQDILMLAEAVGVTTGRKIHIDDK